MRIDRIAANLRALLRANAIIADIHARRFAARSGLIVFAALIAAFGTLMFGLAAYFALQAALGPVWAAALVGLANCVFAGILCIVASRIRPGRELELAREVHNTAAAGLMAEARALESEYESFRQGVRSPVDSALSGLIVPLAGIVIKAFQKRSEKSSAPSS